MTFFSHPFFLYFMSAIYVLAGFNHFLNPQTYIKIIPTWLPSPVMINYVSGLAEIVLGILLLFNSTRTLAAWGVIVLLIAIFPANIQMSINFYNSHHPKFWWTIARLPLQVGLIAWAWSYIDYKI